MDGVIAAYRRAGCSWATDAALAYGPLARHLVARCPIDLRDRLVLDAGSGTGLAGDAAHAVGAEVVAVDAQADMMAAGSDPHRRCIVAEVDDLPFNADSFDATLAAFVLNHLDQPDAALREFARVTRPDGVVMCSTFSSSRAAAKSLVDDVVERHGWTPPSWYLHLHRCAERVGTVDRMTSVARQAGLAIIDVTDDEIDLDLTDAALIVRYRMAMPHIAPFVESLPPLRRQQVLDEATDAVARTAEPFRPGVIELVAAVSPAAARALG